MRNTYSMMRAGLSQIKRDTVRLEEKLGLDLPREENHQTRMRPNAEPVSGLKIAQALSNLKLPPVPEGGALVYGRVVDTLLRGIANLQIALYDEKGRLLKSLGESETDTSGYYSLVLDTKKAKTKTILEGGQLAISTPAGNIVFKEPTPIQLHSGQRRRLDLTLKKLIVMADSIDFQWASNL